MNIRKIIKEEIDDFDWTRDIDIPDSIDSLESRLTERFPDIVMARSTQYEDMLEITTIIHYRDDGDGVLNVGNYNVTGMVVKLTESRDAPYVSGTFQEDYYEGYINASDMWFSQGDSYETIVTQLEELLNPNGSPENNEQYF